MAYGITHYILEIKNVLIRKYWGISHVHIYEIIAAYRQAKLHILTVTQS